jgi:uncharacterized protein DUF6489
MKLHFDIECTPEEAREFLGLPEVKPMQDRLMAELEEQMRANMKALDPQTMLNTWLPAGMKGWEQLQEMFFAQMGRGAPKK